MSALFGVLIGFLLAVNWDKHKDWQRFRTTIKWITNRMSRLLWGGVHGICSLGLTHILGGDGAEVLKAMAYSLIENYLKCITQEIVQ